MYTHNINILNRVFWAMCCPCRHGTWAPWRRARHTRQGFWSFWSTLLAFLVASPGWYFYAAVRTHVHISTTVAIYTQYCTYTPMGHNCSAPAVGLPPCDSVNAVIAAHLGAGSWPWTRTAWYVVVPGVVWCRAWSVAHCRPACGWRTREPTCYDNPIACQW